VTAIAPYGSAEAEFTATLIAPELKVVKVPTEVSELPVTPAARVVPVSVPAGAITALPEAAVINPFAFTVIEGIEVLEPNEPTFEFTVAKVAANEPVPEPVTSEVSVIVCVPVFVPDRFEPVTVPVAATDVGVIAPRDKAIVPDPVIGPPVEPIPFAPETSIEVTVPPVTEVQVVFVPFV